MEDIDQCPICGSEVLNRTLICKDYLVSNGNFEITSCTDCGFYFTNPRPSDEHLADFYKSEDYVSHSESKKGIINKLFLKARKYTLNQKLQTIKSLTSGRNLLDVGCGSASFLNVCKKDGFNVVGVEPSEEARKVAIEKHSINVFPIEEFNNFEHERFDVITLWHVLEHVSDIKSYFTKFKEIITKDGYLVIALPNRLSYDALKYGKYWAAYDVPRHLYHFRKEDIKNLAEQFDFALVKTIPMKLDAFYIAMLSEKNISGKNHLIKSFFTGLKSNCYAKRHDENYSSLIYVFQQTNCY